MQKHEADMKNIYFLKKSILIFYEGELFYKNGEETLYRGDIWKKRI